MFDDQKLIGNQTALPLFDETLLKCVRLGVTHASEIAELAITH
jgi:hypothetical protein